MTPDAGASMKCIEVVTDAGSVLFDGDKYWFRMHADGDMTIESHDTGLTRAGFARGKWTCVIERDAVTGHGASDA